MKLSSPDADEVFFKFLERTDSKKINKTFGVAKEAITSAENVKSVEKSAFLYFTSEKRKKKLKQDKKELKAEEVSASKLKNIKFYVFKEDVDIDAWRGSDFVPMLKNLKEVRCIKCSGKGTKKCDKCNDSRSISCEDCNGKETEKCNPCDGKGTITAELKVLEVNGKGEEKTKYEKRTYQCQKCFGSGERACKNCGGTKIIVCYECKGNSVSCRECDGVGMHYELKDGPVPLAITPGKELHSFLTKKDEWMRKDKEYQKKLESAETLSIQDPQQLNEKDLKNLFGVL